jgi:hypothetical protein
LDEASNKDGFAIFGQQPRGDQRGASYRDSLFEHSRGDAWSHIEQYIASVINIWGYVKDNTCVYKFN